MTKLNLEWRDDFIRRYGTEAYEEKKRENREKYWSHPEEDNEISRKWRERNPEQVRLNSKEQYQKGGKYYEKWRGYNKTGLRLKRNAVRSKYRMRYHPYKKIIAPESQLHYEWIPETADYRGIALVEADQHMRGIINVIQILEGEITLFTEKEVSATLGLC